VGIAAVLLHATAPTMNSAAKVIEIASYALIILIGVRLIWVKGRSFVTAARALREALAKATTASEITGLLIKISTTTMITITTTTLTSTVRPIRTITRSTPAPACGHAHAPEPSQLAGSGGWQRGLSVIVAVGLRPCSGAIIVLVFALANGLFWAGSPRPS